MSTMPKITTDAKSSVTYAPPHTINWKIGKCHGMGTDIFFDQSRSEESKARTICYDRCPIRCECFMYGLTQAFGMWGGLSEKERRNLDVMKTFINCRTCNNRAIELTHEQFIAQVCDHCGVTWLL